MESRHYNSWMKWMDRRQLNIIQISLVVLATFVILIFPIESKFFKILVSITNISMLKNIYSYHLKLPINWFQAGYISHGSPAYKLAYVFSYIALLITTILLFL